MTDTRGLDPLLDFTGKVVLITGAAQGLGKLLAEELALRGAQLVLGDIKVEAMNDVVHEINGREGEAIGLACDVSTKSDCAAMVDAAVETFGRLDIAVNNAGIAGEMKHVTDFTEADMDLQFSVNAKGVMFGQRQFHGGSWRRTQSRDVRGGETCHRRPDKDRRVRVCER
jgi:NAD(P)-dependent dehydrogenase (short-subunit alcohol dehydrogenase family)